MQQTWNLIQQGGPTMVPLLLCSVLALTLILERAWMLRRARVITPQLVELARGYRPGDDRDEALGLCDRHDGAFAAVLRAVLDDPSRERELTIERAQSAGRRAVRQLDRGLVALEIIAAISPLLGLFGTVLGMFNTFQVIAEQGLGDPGALSGGISEALVTTIFGLGVAIPAVVAQTGFSQRVEDLVLEIEEHAGRLIDRLYPDGRKLTAAERGEAA